MDYGRFNYVAQPGDGARLIPIIGPYDKFAVEWGYKEFKDAKTYEEEKAKLDEIVARQLKRSHAPLRRPESRPRTPPSRPRTWAPTRSPPPRSASRTSTASPATSSRPPSKKGEDYEQLRNMYAQLVGQRNRELGHVANLVGGFVRNNVWFGDGDRVYDSVPARPAAEGRRAS